MNRSFKESVIIPVALYEEYKKIKKNNTKSTAQQILNIDANETNPILKRQAELLDKKLFNTISYPTYSSNINTTQPEPMSTSESFNPRKSITNILNNITDSQKPNIKMILEKMLDNNISWNSKKEIIIKNNIITKSNIDKIMKYISSKTPPQKKIPIGAYALYQILPNIGVPASWIKAKPYEPTTPPYSTTKYPFEESRRRQIRTILAERYKELSEKEDKSNEHSSEDTIFFNTDKDLSETDEEKEKSIYTSQKNIPFPTDKELTESDKEEEISFYKSLKNIPSTSYHESEQEGNADLGIIKKIKPSSYESKTKESESESEILLFPQSSDLSNASNAKRSETNIFKKKNKNSKKNTSKIRRSKRLQKKPQTKSTFDPNL